MRKCLTLFLAFTFWAIWSAQGQDTTENNAESADSTATDSIAISDGSTPMLHIIPPALENWKIVGEGELRNLQVNVENVNEPYELELVEGKNLEASLDSTGYFSWTPSYDLVDRLEGELVATMLFEVRTESGKSARKSVDFVVKHVNRPPSIGELRNFYVQYNAENSYQIDLNAVTDPDDDPIIFRPIPSIMPEGASLSEKGVFTWKPSLRQFSRLREEAVKLSFIAEDQPAKAQTKGHFYILATQMDLPPEITIIPNENRIVANEDETINIKFFLSDPNGDDDISEFGLVSEDLRISEKQLVQNTQTQWEFVWTPGYDYVRDFEDSVSVEVSFFVVDKSHLRDEIRIRITVLNKENQDKIDQMSYTRYRTSLVRVWDLLKQLEEREEEYYKRLKKARRGKTSLAITDASLGAVTALSPYVIEDQKSKEIVTGVGGTTVMTMGTLEAADVIAKSPTEIIQNLNKIIEKKNELLLHGNVFARRYSTLLSRRDGDFQKDIDDLLSRLLLKDVASLELDAGWKNPKTAKDKNLRDYFPDFVSNPDL